MKKVTWPHEIEHEENLTRRDDYNHARFSRESGQAIPINRDKLCPLKNKK
ncbi:hypothetical protein [Aquiflexum sp.]